MVEAEALFPVVLDDVSVYRKQTRVLGPLNIRFEQTGCTVLMGPNGAGKTTFLRLLHGLVRPREGKVVWALPPEQTYARQSFVFQTPIVMRRTVQDNIAYPLIVRGAGKRQGRQQADEWIDRVGLAHVAHKDAGVISGGERQKLALARALITAPDVLFLDEPSTNLDGASTRDIEALIQAVVRDGTRVFLATHDLGQARRLADNILFIHHGAILEHAECDAFFDHPATPEARSFLRGDILL
ncbi:ATP-binding cassette domain-containing protein [Sneathiella chinensis]|uniref:ABC transporter ATP-binding protein n=1 Tax=Sneathiella chinensis TaxID=349750 RepID=A0ABQ5U1E2_9PROT|nr:ATP-binding cassette domain-containing protein [Sneathiella chinensis]GLQ05947.1 ABC transporter ATP-binding protein [Sneathiella chinensis]